MELVKKIGTLEAAEMARNVPRSRRGLDRCIVMLCGWNSVLVVEVGFGERLS